MMKNYCEAVTFNPSLVMQSPDRGGWKGSALRQFNDL